MDLDELQVLALRPQLLGEAVANVGMDGLDERGFPHSARAPEQRVVGGQAAREALGIVGELRRHVLEALEEHQRHAVDLCDGLERVPLGVPDEGFRRVEIARRRTRRAQPL